MRLSSWKEFLFLLRREFLFQLDGRRSYPRGVYPGVNWFALLCAAAVLLEFNSSRLAPESSTSVTEHFTYLTLAQLFLIALRSTVYCAVSMSRDLQSHTATVVRVSPVSRTLTLAAKLSACLTPLWMELLLYLPVAVAFFSVYLWLPPLAILATVGFLLSASILFGCLGLVIGSTNSIPAQSARSSRLLIFFLFFVFPILAVMSEGWMIPLAALAVWLSATSRRAPHRTLLLLSAGIVVGGLAALQSVTSLESAFFHPLAFTGQYLTSVLLTSRSRSLIETPLGMSMIYLGLSAIFFMMARARYQYTR